MKIITTTKSAVKLAALRAILNPQSIVSYSTEEAKLPAQPINTGLTCCHRRIDYIKEHNDLSQVQYDYIISIENGIDTISHYEKGGDAGHYVDICYVVMEDKEGNRSEYESKAIPIPYRYIELARVETAPNYKHRDLGYEWTGGYMINKEYPEIDHANWMADARFGSYSRVQQIESAILTRGKL